MEVTRRHFVGGVIGAAASLLLPRLKLVPDYDLHALARKWCSRYPSPKYDLHLPYVMDDYAYATDARAMVRFNDNILLTDGAAKIPKQTTEVWHEFWRPTKKWLPMPQKLETVLGDRGDCWKCNAAFVECPACCGYGEHCGLPGDYIVHCETCNGSGTWHDPACDVCHGRYDQSFPTVAVIDSKLYGLEYVSRLLELPGVQINSGLQDSHSPILFHSEISMDGIIMPRMRA